MVRHLFAGLAVLVLGIALAMPNEAAPPAKKGNDPQLKAAEKALKKQAKTTTRSIRARGKAAGRDVSTIINPHVICRETEAEAWAQHQAILEHQDTVAADNFYATFAGGDQSSWKGTSRDQWVIGGNVHIVGTPEQVVDGFQRLADAGCDGVQVNFYDFLPDLEFFGERVVPLMQQAGLRIG